MDIPLLILSLGLVATLSLAFIREYRARMTIRSLKKRLTSLEERSASPLLKALTNFSQGDLTVHIEDVPPEEPDHPAPHHDSIHRQVVALENLQKSAIEEFNNLTGTVSRRLCFIGGDAYSQGKQCAEIMATQLKAGAQVVISTGHLNASGQSLRCKGFTRALADSFPGIKVLGILENEEKPEHAYRQTFDYLKQNPDLAGIYVTEGATPFMVAKAVKDAGRSNSVSIVCQDLSEETISCIRDGTIMASLADSTFAQGHDPVVHLFNHLASGWQPGAPRMTIDADVVDAHNWQEYWKIHEGPIHSTRIMDRLAKPQPVKENRPFHITVIGCENSPYWYPIRDGAVRAARELERFGTRVEWVVRKGQDLTREVVGSILDEAVRNGTDAVALIAEDTSIITLVNQLVDRGIPVVTYITEPTSLRGFIATVSDQSRRVHQLNQGVLEGASIVSSANKHLQDALQATVNRAEEQAGLAQNSQTAMTYLMEELRLLNNQAIDSQKSSEATMRAVEDGNQAVQSTFSSIQIMEETFKHSYQLIETLSNSTEQINASIEAIRTVANQVNVLAFNAAVEAARAGSAGAGFKVLSEEIRKLSDQASSGTTQITRQIQAIRQGVLDTRNLMSTGVKSLAQTSELAMLADVTFANIRSLSSDEKDRSAKVAIHLAAMVTKSQAVLDELVHMAEDSTLNAETLRTIELDGRTIQDQFEKVNQGAKELSNLASVEQTLLARFKQ